MFGKNRNTDDGKKERGGLSDQLAEYQAGHARAQAEAADMKLGMTLRELDAFVHNALAQGGGDNTPVMVRVNITGGVKRIWTREEKTVD